METIDNCNIEDGNTPKQNLGSIPKPKKVKTEKTYTVNIIYVPITEEKARIKLLAIKDIIKRAYFKKCPPPL
jgi:ribosomal protein L14E/L6E/L27E